MHSANIKVGGKHRHLVLRQWATATAMTALTAAALLLAAGCSSSSESAAPDTLTKNVGEYPPGPSGVNHPRVGVPPFSVQGSGIFSQQND